MRSIAIALFAAAASRVYKNQRSRTGKKMRATLEKPRANVGTVEKVDLTPPAPNTLPPLTLETIELDDLVIVPDVVW